MVDSPLLMLFVVHYLLDLLVDNLSDQLSRALSKTTVTAGISITIHQGIAGDAAVLFDTPIN